MSRTRWLVFAACALLLAVFAATRVTRSPAPSTPAPTAAAPTGRVQRLAVDVAKFHAMRQTLIDRAKALAARRAEAPRPEPPAPSDLPTTLAVGKPSLMDLIVPCKVGPAELCETIHDVAEDCDAKDGQACLAVAQLLADTPPRSVLARVFLHRACLAEEEEACARMKLLDGTEPISCDADAFACGYRAYKSKDPVALDDACARGFAEACVQLVPIRGGDRKQARAYLEHGCQLGDPNACDGLGFMLSAACDDPELCFDPDPLQSAAAYAIACAAGWQESCRK